MNGSVNDTEISRVVIGDLDIDSSCNLPRSGTPSGCPRSWQAIWGRSQLSQSVASYMGEEPTLSQSVVEGFLMRRSGYRVLHAPIGIDPVGTQISNTLKKMGKLSLSLMTS